MLFIVGTKSHNIKNGQFENFRCPKCSETTTFNYSLYKRYAHLTFIPLFPVDKEIYVACSSCSEIIDWNEYPEELKAKAESIKVSNTFISTFWMYSGIIILIGFAIFVIYSFFNTNDISKTYLKNLKKEDVLNVKLSNGYYSTIRIDEVTKDSIYCTSNDYRVDLPYERNEIDIPENYTNSKIKYSKKDVVRLYDNGEINSIIRKE